MLHHTYGCRYGENGYLVMLVRCRCPMPYDCLALFLGVWYCILIGPSIFGFALFTACLLVWNLFLYLL